MNHRIDQGPIQVFTIENLLSLIDQRVIDYSKFELSIERDVVVKTPVFNIAYTIHNKDETEPTSFNYTAEAINDSVFDNTEKRYLRVNPGDIASRLRLKLTKTLEETRIETDSYEYRSYHDVMEQNEGQRELVHEIVFDTSVASFEDLYHFQKGLIGRGYNVIRRKTKTHVQFLYSFTNFFEVSDTKFS